MMLKEAIKNELELDPEIVRALASWQFETGVDAPAIFTDELAPDACGAPLITLASQSGEEDSVRGLLGGRQNIMLRIWGDKSRSSKELDKLGWAVYEYLRGRRLEFGDYETNPIRLGSPSDLLDGDGYPGRLMLLEIKFITKEN